MSGRLTNQEMNAFFFGHNDKWPGARGNETVRQIPCLEDKEQRPLMYFSKKIFEKKKLFEREQMLLHNECYFSYWKFVDKHVDKTNRPCEAGHALKLRWNYLLE